MAYFRETYVDCKHFVPIRWLHIGLKESQFHDPTNNTSESLNKVLKMNSKNNLSFEHAVRKIHRSILYYKSQFLTISQTHKQKFSFEYFLKRKFKTQIEILERENEFIKEYSLLDYK